MRGDNDFTLGGHSEHVHCVAFSSDGRQLASGAEAVILRDAQTGYAKFRLEGHAASVAEVSFSPNGTRLASAADDNTVRLWNTETGEEVAVLKGHTQWVSGVAYSPDGNRLVSSSRDGTIKLWDAQTHEETATLKGHRGVVYCVVFSPDGSCLASASSDNTVKLWDVETGNEIRTFTGHTGLVRTVAFDQTGKRLVSGGYDTKIRVWDVASNQQIATAHASGGGAVFGVAFSPDGKRFAACGTDHSVQLIETLSGQEIMTFFPGKSGVESVAFSPDGTRLAAAVAGIGNIRIWDAPQKHETAILSAHSDTVTSVTFSLDGSRIYSESENEKLIWNVATRETLPDAMWEPTEVINHASPDGRWFVTTESNNVVLVDLEYKNTPDEKARRKTKASFDSFWHQEQATAATTAKNWYAATFHFAWLMKHDPDGASCHDYLNSSFERLKTQFELEDRDLDPHLARVVKESLQRVDEWTNPSFEEPRIRKGTWSFQEAIPRWNTTGKMFEVWSSGFQDVTAHDGEQFVELNAREEGTLYQDLLGIERDAVLEFSFAHRGRNGEDTVKLTITDLGSDNETGGGDDRELFAKEYTTGNSAWAVYDSTTEPTITAVGNKVRFAYIAVYATGGRGPDNTEGNFLDAAEFGVGVVTTRRKASGVK